LGKVNIGNQDFISWAPVVIWLAVLWFFSSSLFTSVNTGSAIAHILRWIFDGHLPHATFRLINIVIRKTGHFGNYAVLFLLMIRGPMRQRPYAALMLCVMAAAVDETHQVFVPGRTATPYDVALDSTGAMFARFLYLAVAGS
jgi:VanZ family protein